MDLNIDILNWINNFGFVEATDIANTFNLKLESTYLRLRKLVSLNYLQSEKIIYGTNTIYYLTKSGKKISQNPLPILKKINLATYYHNLMLVKISPILTKQYNAQFVTERQLKHERKIKGHISDGLLLYDNKKIAIELELSTKNKKRRDSIMKFYLRNFEFDEIWYICKNLEIKKQLLPFTDKMFFLKIFELDDLLKVAEHKSHA
jgi:hypothetical protein